MEGMSSEQLRWHLPGKWCAAEVLEHLYLTYAGTTRGLEKVIARGTPLATRPSLTQRVLTSVVVNVRYMPAGREAPIMVLPRGMPVEQVRNEIWVTLAAMDAIIARCEARFGRHVKLLDHPILGALSAPQWRTLHLVLVASPEHGVPSCEASSGNRCRNHPNLTAVAGFVSACQRFRRWCETRGIMCTAEALRDPAGQRRRLPVHFAICASSN